MLNKGIAAIMVNQHRHTRVSRLAKFHLLKLLGGLFFIVSLHVNITSQHCTVNVNYYKIEDLNYLKSYYTITIMILPVQIGHVK